MSTIYHLKFRRLFLCLVIVLPSALFFSCGNQKLYHATFKADPINQAPLNAQEVGTAQTDGGANAVTVIHDPQNPPGKWVKIKRESGATNLSAFQGRFNEFKGNGSYTFSTTLIIPEGCETLTVQFERFNQPINQYESFMHIDFLESNQMRINDDSSTLFGTFPRNQIFIIQVTLNINDTSSNADIVLAGVGAAGESHYEIPFNSFAKQFGAVRLWMGSQSTGEFKATNILVKLKN